MIASRDTEAMKRAAAAAALAFVESEMVLGLGTGSTVRHLLELLAEALEERRLEGIVGVPTSSQTEERSKALGIPLMELGAGAAPDLCIDGADEIGPGLDLVKGMGGALLREKMVAQASGRVVIIADESKVVTRLGTRSPLPVEVVRWGVHAHMTFLEAEGASVTIRATPAGQPLLSDNGNYFLDCRFPDGIREPAALEERLARRAGVVETGLFLGMADVAVLAGPDGVRTMTRDG